MGDNPLRAFSRSSQRAKPRPGQGQAPGAPAAQVGGRPSGTRAAPFGKPPGFSQVARAFPAPGTPSGNPPKLYPPAVLIRPSLFQPAGARARGGKPPARSRRAPFGDSRGPLEEIPRIFQPRPVLVDRWAPLREPTRNRTPRPCSSRSGVSAFSAGALRGLGRRRQENRQDFPAPAVLLGSRVPFREPPDSGSIGGACGRLPSLCNPQGDPFAAPSGWRAEAG